MIEIKSLQKIVGQRTALDIPALTVESGEIAAVVGPADSGKDTLFELLTGKIQPSAGEISLAGVSPASKAELSYKVGILFPEDGLYQRRSSQGNLVFHCQLFSLPKSRAQQVLEQIGMADQANTSQGKLSSGLQRRLAFGRAILHQPQVLILYEPFIRCDQTSINLLGALIRQLADEGAAVLIMAGDTTHLTSFCSAIYTLDRGRLVAVTRADEEQQTSREQTTTMPFKIPVRLEDKVILVNPADVLFVEAESGHARLHLHDGPLSTQFTLNELEVRLARSGFFRAHRAYLVNLQHVKEVIPYTRNSFSLRLDDPANTVIPLSKSAAGELRTLLGY
jgi:ABC-2 type transport system ATP-binding protein